ncbi:hypothetical protein BDV19DRAFT_354936 [Aspergillus venezuelensis]
MSGVEIAGLALAVFPILVNQLDKYVRGIEKIKILRRYKHVVKDHSLSLETQGTIFLNSLERVLEGVADDDELQGVIKDPGGKQWKDPLLQKRLRVKLDRSYASFVENTASLHALLVDLAKKLDIDIKEGVQNTTPSSTEVLLFLRALNKAVFDDHLQKVKEANDALKTLVEQSVQLESSREKRGPWRHLLPRLREARKNAEGLYRAIVQGSYWSCQCRGFHSAHLPLRSSPTAEKKKSNSKSNFCITFSNTAGSDGVTRSWTWTEVEFEPCEFSQGLSVTDVEKALERVQISRSPRVRFNIPETVQKMFNSSGSPPAIEDICSVLSRSEKQPAKHEAVGFITQEPSSTIRYILHSIRYHSQVAPLQTLQQALPNSSRRDRLYIAASLACGLIQYHGNWLKAHWDSSDIQLTWHSDDIGDIVPDSVYLSWPLELQQADMILARDEPPSPLIRNQILFPLALALTELSLGKSIASLRLPQDEQGHEDSTRFHTAFRLLNKVYRESGSTYGDVVYSCLLWPGAGMSTKTFCFEDEKFEGKVFNTVVAPLLRDLSHFDDDLGFRL